MTAIALFSVSDWKNPKEYCLNSIEALPQPFVQSLQEHSLSDEEILYINLRWQFLRRHPRYQLSWAICNGSVFGMQCPSCPAPSNSHPVGLMFWENSKGKEYLLPWINMKIAKQDPATLSRSDKSLQTVVRSFYPSLKFHNFEYPVSKLIRKSKKNVRMGDLPTALRVIDALADGISLKEIERTLGRNTDKMGRILKNRAARALVEVTGISL